MNYTVFGKTGLQVSQLALGTGNCAAANLLATRHPPRAAQLFTALAHGKGAPDLYRSLRDGAIGRLSGLYFELFEANKFERFG